MKRTKYFLILPFALLMLSSCSHSVYVTTSTLCEAKPGAKYSETVFQEIRAAYILDFNDLGTEPMKVYVYKKLEEGRDAVIGSNAKYDYCAVVFKSDKLYYWGYVDDLKKENNVAIRTIGENISQKLIKDN